MNMAKIAVSHRGYMVFHMRLNRPYLSTHYSTNPNTYGGGSGTRPNIESKLESYAKSEVFDRHSCLYIFIG
jgi:hypothetical protein